MPELNTIVPQMAFCSSPFCGVIKVNPDYDGPGENGDEIQFDDRYIPCSKCGQPASTFNGIYRLQNRKLSFVRELPAQKNQREALLRRIKDSSRLKQPPQISHCLRCGNVFPSEMQLVFTADETPPKSLRTEVTNCPRCRKLGESGMPSGFFHHDKKTNQTTFLSELLDGPELTPEVLTQLKTLAEQALTSPEKSAELIEKISTLAPSFTEQFRDLIKTPAGLISFISLLVSLLAISIQVHDSLKDEKPLIIKNYHINSPTSQATPLLENTYKRPALSPTKRGSNLTPPKKKRPATSKGHRKK